MTGMMASDFKVHLMREKCARRKHTGNQNRWIWHREYDYMNTWRRLVQF